MMNYMFLETNILAFQFIFAQVTDKTEVIVVVFDFLISLS